MKTTIHLVIFFFTLMSNKTIAQSKKILIVSTNVDSLQGDANGTFLMEIAYPIDTLRKLGIETAIITPLGGKAAIYHRGTMNQSLAAIAASEFFQNKVTHTLAPHEINVHDYDGIFYPGGGGQFYDVWNNDSIARIAAAIYDNGGSIGTAGHGAVSLLNIQLKDGSFFVKGKRITCFPKKISAGWLPVDWEKGLQQKGAIVVLPATADEKENGVQLADTDGRTISGSYAENAAWVVAQMIARRKRTGE